MYPRPLWPSFEDEIERGLGGTSELSEPRRLDIEARIWAGLHYRTADVQAEELGRNVAEYMAQHYFQAVGG